MPLRRRGTAATGKKPSGRVPPPPVAAPLPSDQINLTDEESRIMPAAGGGFEQCYNAQAAVTAGSLLVVAADVVQAPNDKQQLAPVRQQRIRLAKFVGQRSEFVQHGIAESRAEAIVIWEGLPQTILLIEYSLNLKRTVNQEQYQRHRRIVLGVSSEWGDHAALANRSFWLACG